MRDYYKQCYHKHSWMPFGAHTYAFLFGIGPGVKMLGHQVSTCLVLVASTTHIS